LGDLIQRKRCFLSTGASPRADSACIFGEQKRVFGQFSQTRLENSRLSGPLVYLLELLTGESLSSSKILIHQNQQRGDDGEEGTETKNNKIA
jgi:hypothetical protein